MDRHLKLLEEESIMLIREIISTVPLSDIWCFYSIGKDSTCLLRLIEKAFSPSKIGIKFLHIDTGYKFKEMYEFKEIVSKKIELITHKSDKNLNPYTDSNYTDVMKTDALNDALSKYNIKVAFGGARREEEKSRAKERMVSVRNTSLWNPKNQNSEVNYLWNTLYNDDISLRVFPLSNWTELDIWNYIKCENLDVVPIYFTHKRNVIEKDGLLIPTETNEGEEKNVRFRTLGCYPLTAAIESVANNLDDIILELENTKYSERFGRLIDMDKNTMEVKKIQGYF
jgi:sulfate adenylyltransferase subunit 2